MKALELTHVLEVIQIHEYDGPLGLIYSASEGFQLPELYTTVQGDHAHQNETECPNKITFPHTCKAKQIVSMKDNAKDNTKWS